MSTHGQQEITDPVEQMLKKTGCMELHFKVQVRYVGKCVYNYSNICFRNVLLKVKIGENVKTKLVNLKSACNVIKKKK